MDEQVPSQIEQRPEGPPALSVTELSQQLVSCLSHYFQNMWVEAEVGKVREIPEGGRGNVYLTLKDDESSIDAVIWSRQRASMKYIPQKGDMVRVRAHVTVNKRQGSCSLHIQHLEPTGQGLLLLELEERRQRLAAGGVFSRALPLPMVPRAVALITSRGSDAEIDFLKTASKRAPGFPIHCLDARMQGREESVVQGLKDAFMRAAAIPNVEVLVLTRGGGLIEHLWVFNNEELCRFIADAPLPVVVSIGHESNLLLAELAADMRCSTPTYAAMEVIPEATALRAQLESLIAQMERGVQRQGAYHAQQLRLMTQALRPPSTQRSQQRLDQLSFELERAMQRQVDQKFKRFTQLKHSLESLAPDARLARVGQGIHAATQALHRVQVLPAKRQRLERLEERLHEQMRALLKEQGAELGRLAASLHALSPLETLSRGYSITTRHEGAELIDDASALSAGDRLSIQLMRGRVEVEVLSVDPNWSIDQGLTRAPALASPKPEG